ncbi:MAG: enoyl-CoA hydratase/isomerase family protein [Balneolaceae bacterium]|nr:enoyl-CoA hydratase/isomerase family protein [Balneolaceae bacterium]
MTGELSVSVANGIASLEFYHPKGNSLPSDLLSKLAESISRLGNDNEVKVIVLRSKGNGAFCAGASFDELLAIDSHESANTFFKGFGHLISAIKNCPKFVIARVHGKAVGGGVGIIAACDYAIGSKAASIKLSELSIGFGPFVIAPAVIRKIGISAFSTLTIDTKNWKNSDWAERKGLFNEVVDGDSELDDQVNTLADQLASYSAEAMKEIKAMLWEGFENIETTFEKRAKLSGSLSQSEVTQAILTKFKQGS